MNQQQQMPVEIATEIIEGIHKRAFLGRLAQHGLVPATALEEAAAIDLGISLINQQSTMKSAADRNQFGDGPFAQCLDALNAVTQEPAAPGFEKLQKVAAAEDPAETVAIGVANLPQALQDSAFKAACDLATDPMLFQAAVIKRAHNEQLATAQAVQIPEPQASGPAETGTEQ